jgi:prephenate dehydratase
MAKLLFLGPEGSFSHILAKQLLSDQSWNFELQACETFSEIAARLEDSSEDRGLLVIENSITSDVHEAVDLFFAKKLWIEAEAQLRITMNLVGLEQAKLEDIRTVSSKLPAIAQCSEFIASRSLKATFTDSTSQALMNIIASGDCTAAAIGAKALIEEYPGTKILAENVGNQINNLTRFVLVRNRENETTFAKNSNKLTLIVELPHVTGALARYLSILADVQANLTRIESRPVPGTDWEYQFWIDLEVPEGKLESVIAQARTFASNFQLLGVYAKGKVFKS